jgi:hypothetical protein
MRPSIRHAACFVLALTAVAGLPALAADADLDALSLESAPEATPAPARSTKFFVEGAVGNASQRYLPDSRNLGRASFDFSYTTRLSPQLRAVFSDRLDHMDPAEPGVNATVNSLREAYVSWQADSGNTVWEFGRINLRYGPAYGYNPTDFFREGSLRTLTSTNPFAMRENRLGSVMLRAQRLWAGGSMSAAYSPKLDDQPSPDGWSLDMGSTNYRDRALVELSTQHSDRFSSQVMVYKAQDQSPVWGVSATSLLSDAAVAHAEWTSSSEVSQLNRALGRPGATAQRNRFAGGVTYTTLGKLSVTAEVQYNGFAPSDADWAGLAPADQVTYQTQAMRWQELVPRQAYLIYVTQKGLLLKDLDLTAFLRLNAQDQSRMTWLELRHHWPQLDVSLQLQQYSGQANSEYGILSDSRVIQVLGNYYF